MEVGLIIGLVACVAAFIGGYVLCNHIHKIASTASATNPTPVLTAGTALIDNGVTDLKNDVAALTSRLNALTTPAPSATAVKAA